MSGPIDRLNAIMARSSRSPEAKASPTRATIAPAISRSA